MTGTELGPGQGSVLASHSSMGQTGATSNAAHRLGLLSLQCHMMDGLVRGTVWTSHGMKIIRELMVAVAHVAYRVSVLHTLAC